MIDDRGKRVRVLGRAGFHDWPVRSDARITAMVGRLELAVKGSRQGLRMLWSVAFALMGPMALVILWEMLRVLLPGLPHWIASVGMVVVCGLVSPFTVRWMSRLSERAVADVLLEEGVCPCCGYNFHGLAAVSDGCLVCPECASGWRAERVLRTAPFVGGGSRNVFAAVGSGFGSVLEWTTRDDRGRLVRLSEPRLKWRLKETSEPRRRARLLRARAMIRRSARAQRTVMMAIFGLIAAGTWVVVGGVMAA